MKIRPQLGLLLIVAVTPIAILCAVAIEQLWSLQRSAYEQKFLERVSALRLAQDTEIDATLRTLRTLAGVPDIDRELDRFVERFQRLLDNNPLWSTIGLMAPEGAVVARLDKEALPGEAVLDAATRGRAIATAQPAISDLVSTSDGKTHLTYLAAPVVRGGQITSVLYVGVESRRWLQFLQRYPISSGATLTLNDRNGLLIARTLYHERWVGKRSGDAFLKHTIGASEGAFLAPGLDGQNFYTAFSRSPLSGWLMGTGVPRSEVEAALRLPTVAILVAILFAVALAVALAALFGRRIATALTRLESDAKATATGKLGPGVPLGIDEADSVRRSLGESAALLRAREDSLGEALRREADARALAERANEAKDEFLAMLGHELRNPLAAMKTATDVLDMTGPQTDAGQRARGVMQRQIRHVTQMVDEMLDVARLTSGKVVLRKETLDLAEVARYVIQTFADSGRSAHVTVDARLSHAPLFADETRMEQIVTNLLDNACKYTPSGRSIHIVVEASETQSTLTVRDHGSGIPADLLPRVFETFAQEQRTLDRSQGGLGLGLSIVRRLVELHGGSISALSDGPDRGSTFAVRFPRAVDAAAPAPAAAPGASLPPLRFAIVDDKEDNRESLSSLLRVKGHAVMTAADGPSGHELLTSEAVDVALIDVGLPGYDGMELARRLRSEPRRRPTYLVAVTGYGSEEDRSRALDAGFDAFLVKPIGLNELEDLIRQALSLEAPRRSA